MQGIGGRIRRKRMSLKKTVRKDCRLGTGGNRLNVLDNRLAEFGFVWIPVADFAPYGIRNHQITLCGLFLPPFVRCHLTPRNHLIGGGWRSQVADETRFEIDERFFRWISHRAKKSSRKPVEMQKLIVASFQ